MKYDLAMPETEFLQADRVVRSMLLGTRIEQKALRLATSDSELLRPDNKVYLEENPSSVGICFNHDKRFDIWVTPAYTNTDTDSYRDTILHELTHGYLGVYAHNHRFKRFFGRVLHHYDSLVSPLDVDTLIPDMLKRYTNQGKDESFKKYCERIEFEQDAIAKIAVDELNKVSLSYYGMTDKEEARARNSKQRAA